MSNEPLTSGPPEVAPGETAAPSRPLPLPEDPPVVQTGWLSDRTLPTLGAAWVAAFALGVYAR